MNRLNKEIKDEIIKFLHEINRRTKRIPTKDYGKMYKKIIYIRLPETTR